MALAQMHFKSPSMGSEPCLLKKASFGPFLYDSTKSTTNSSLTASFVRKDSNTPLYDALSVNTLSLSHIFLNSTTVFKKAPLKERVVRTKRSTENTLGSGSGMRQSLLNLENSFVCSINRRKKKNIDIREFFTATRQGKQSLNTSQVSTPNESRVYTRKRSLEDFDNNISIMEPNIEPNKTMQSLEIELRKKEMIIQIYQKLIEICRGAEKVAKPGQKSIRVLERQNKTNGASSNSPFGRSMRSSKGKRVIITGEPFTANNSFSPTMTQKTTQSTLNRTLTLQHLRSEDYINTKIERDYPLVVYLKKAMGKGEPNNKELLNMGPRIRKSSSGQRKVKSIRISRENLLSHSGTRSRSNSDTIKKERQGLNLNTSVNFLAGSVDQTTCSIYMSNNNSKIIKNNPFDGLADRFKNICDSYQKTNETLIAKIKDYDRRIGEIQASRQRKV